MFREDNDGEDLMRISRDIRTTITQDGAVLMDIQRGSMLTLNPTGAIIWQHLSGGLPADQVADRLTAEFSIPREQASADVNEFLEQLKAQHLFELTESVNPGIRPSSKLTDIFSALLGRRSSRRALDHSSK